MNLFVLDTDMLSLFRTGNAPVVRRILGMHRQTIAVSVITVEEQLDGWHKIVHRDPKPEQVADRYRRLAETISFYTSLNILNFSVEAIGRYNTLGKMKLNVKPNDLRIAAIVLENNATVVTRNIRDFSRVPGLNIEDWSAE